MKITLFGTNAGSVANLATQQRMSKQLNNGKSRSNT